MPNPAADATARILCQVSCCKRGILVERSGGAADSRLGAQNLDFADPAGGPIGATVLRPIAVIVAALRLSRPDMPVEDATRHATVLQQVAKEHGFDPLTGVAIIHLESGWDASRVSENGEDYGLAQIRARYVGACRNDPDPVKRPSKECRAVQHELLNAAANIRKLGELVTLNRDLCRRKVGSVALERWLASYQGRNFPEKRRWCQPGEQTWAVIRYRQWLIGELSRKGRKSRLSTSAQRQPQVPRPLLPGQRSENR
jgi:hypothetical protein